MLVEVPPQKARYPATPNPAPAPGFSFPHQINRACFHRHILTGTRAPARVYQATLDLAMGSRKG
jgi:hypothetical protein